MKPLIAINFKTYAQASGVEAVELTQKCAAVAQSTGANIMVCVQASDIHACSQVGGVPVFAQHVDSVTPGAHTGKILADSVRENGGVGTLLNHSEDQYADESLAAAVAECRKEGLQIIICADSIDKAVSVSHLNPDYVAYEPPELIGGDVSVTTRPDAITDVVRQVGLANAGVKVLVGAGVKTRDDVKVALSLGASGVLLASGVTKSDDPVAVLEDLAGGATF